MNTQKSHEHEVLSSGKTIIRNFDTNGLLCREQHTYGILDIGISYTFQNGVKIEETYFSKKRLVSRKSYEKARVNYPDMPAPDIAIEDWGKNLLRDMRREQRQHQEEAKRHVANPEEALKRDAFCIKMMARGKRADAFKWIEEKNHTLGEMNWAASRRLIKVLFSLGCLNIHACEIGSDDHGENTGHLVIELPKTEHERKEILKKVDNLAREQGFEGPHDDEQQYVYVGLD